MIRINLLDEDQLSGSPSSQPTRQRRRTSPKIPPPKPQSEEPRKRTPEKSATPGRRTARRQKPYVPDRQTSSIYRGQSLAILIFLIVVGIGVAVYFLYFDNTERFSILGPSIPERVVSDEQNISDDPGVTEEEKGQFPDDEFRQRTEDDLSAIRQFILHGKKITNYSHRIFSEVNDRSFIRFFAVSDEHMSLSALTRTPSFVGNIRAKIMDTDIVADLPLFSSQDYSTHTRTWVELNVYANLLQLDLPDDISMQQENLEAVRIHVKDLISIPEVNLRAWNTLQTSPVDGWNRGFIYSELIGKKESILQVLHSLQVTDHNISISKVLVSSVDTPLQFSDEYVMKLYIVIYGKPTT